VSGTADAEPDESLALAAQRGSRAAFEKLVRRHKTPVYRFVRRYVGNSDDAYDVLQETFISAWIAIRHYDAERPFVPWLRTIALNKCRDFSRRRSVRQLFMQVLAQDAARSVENAVLDMDGTDGEALTTARLQHLDVAVAGLPAIYKEPLLLTTAAGLSQKEAAKILKLTPKALEMRLYRARQKLAAAMERQSEG